MKTNSVAHIMLTLTFVIVLGFCVTQQAGAQPPPGWYWFDTEIVDRLPRL